MKDTWQAEFARQLLKKYGKKEGNSLYKTYATAFTEHYRNNHTIDHALNDIAHIKTLSNTTPLSINLCPVSLQKTSPAKYPLQLRLFQFSAPIPLSNIMPMLDHLDLSVYDESQYLITPDNKTTHTQRLTAPIWITNFNTEYKKPILQFSKVHAIFQEAFYQIYTGAAASDGFNKLILGAGLSCQEVMILRAYAKYLHQVRFSFSQTYIENTLVAHPTIAKQLIHLFLIRHQPNALTKKQRLKKARVIEAQILHHLEEVTSLDEDKIIRRLLDTLKATLRTNYFQETEKKEKKPYFAIKLHSRAIPDLPLPVPLYEIFIYSTRFSGIHLRNTKVARGGIRWSDRPEDFRTEILDLMKAQTVKNSIIVPSGAKGGFVLQKTQGICTPDALRAEVIACYQLFINGLFDLTDNIVNKKIIPPQKVVCYDDNDPYLVVAADKGTATFSDTANAISETRTFWEGDAFASGGKTGYDHKKIGITAKGAWESIKRHFRELNIDVNTTPLTVIGIGDMSGDVFGNGLLYCKTIKLIAAFNQNHIFLDPDPDPIRSYNERLRLFKLPRSSWEDYNPKLISKGGGIFKRSVKSIVLNTAIKKILNIETDTLAPDDLIIALLKAPVDLLFNGGIGTYVKASTESNIDVRDRTNDNCRVNGKELRCKVVGEGGNLGFTQLGRIEYALQGGFINTDSIDNAGGVNCSDHEVNLKLLLDHVIREKKLSYKKRNTLLRLAEKEVAALVLNDNYYQALVMSFTAFHARQNVSLHQAYINELETHKLINRDVESLPSNKTLLERKAANQGLTRPEIAVLLSYTKINIKHNILSSNLPEDPYLSEIAKTAFPGSIMKKYATTLQTHRLYRDIVATQLSNAIVNQMGITFIYRLQIETGATIEEIVRAFTIASNIFESCELRQLVESLDHKISMSTQYEMLYNIRHLVNLATRWFLHSPHIKKDLNSVIQYFAVRVKKLEEVILGLMSGFTKKYLKSLLTQFLQAGLSKKIAKRIATYRAIYTSLNIIEVSNVQSFDLVKTAHVYFAVGERFHLVWFRDQIATDSRDGHWNTLARLSLRDELDLAQRTLTIAIMRKNKKEKNIHKLMTDWEKNNKRIVDRWKTVLSTLHNTNNIDYTLFFIAIRELLGLLSMS